MARFCALPVNNSPVNKRGIQQRYLSRAFQELVLSEAGALQVLLKHSKKTKLDDLEVSMNFLTIFYRSNGLQVPLCAYYETCLAQASAQCIWVPCVRCSPCSRNAKSEHSLYWLHFPACPMRALRLV